MDINVERLRDRLCERFSSGCAGIESCAMHPLGFRQ